MYNSEFMYRDRGIDNMKCMITPIITRATRIITMFKEKFGSRTCETFNIFKTAIYGTSHIIRKVQLSEA